MNKLETFWLIALSPKYVIVFSRAKSNISFVYKAVIFLLMGLIGCSTTPTPTPRASITATTAVNTPVPQFTQTPRPIPTLYPTETLPPTETPRPTLTPRPTEPTPTSLPFDTTLVMMRYAIPAVGLSRALIGNVGGQIALVDDATGQEVQRTNQGVVLVEMQTILRDLTLAEMPAGCEGCVFFSYDLPLDGLSGEGWLQDVQLLASVENFMTAMLGAHMPPEAVMGLRLGASGYDVAQTVAIAPDGRMWRWLATAEQVGEVEETGLDVPALLTPIKEAEFEAQYEVDCINRGIDTLSFLLEDERTDIRLRCPEMSLPTNLVSVYQQLTDFLVGLESEGLALPAYPLPLDGLLFYRRGDGHSLTLYGDETYLLTSPNAGSLTLPLTNTTVISLTTPFVTNPRLNKTGDVLLPALPTEANPEPEQFQYGNLLSVRSESGVTGVGWEETPPAGLGLYLAELDMLVNAGIPTLQAQLPISNTSPITNTNGITNTVP